MLVVTRLKVVVEGKRIINGVNLILRPGELLVVMGPNGSGKSTLAYTLAGHPGYLIKAGSIQLNGQNLLNLSPDKRAQAGLFLGFQYPVAVPGVDLYNLLRQADTNLNGRRDAPFKFKNRLKTLIAKLNLKSGLIDRSINDGFSGGEKKKSEVLQLAVLKPKYAILDEIDSGLDIDAIKLVAAAINWVRRDNPRLGLMIITHYQRILNYLKVDRVVIMKGGLIVKEGSALLVDRLEENGYAEL